MKPSSRRETYILGAAFLVYVTGMTLLALRHEGWRDEADVWLVARDAGLVEMFQLFPYMGTPSLWYLLVRPLAQGGLPYFSMALLHVAVASTTAALILWRSPFPIPMRLLLIFSYYLGYEYAIVARGYALSIAILFCIAALHSRRHERPLTYAGLVFLLVNSTVHGMIIAAVVAAAFVLELIRARSMTRRAAVAVAIMAIGGALGYLQVRTPIDGQRVGTTRIFNPSAGIDAVGQAFLPFSPPAPAFGVGVCALVLIGLVLRARRAGLFLAIAAAGLLAVFVFVWSDGPRHYGLILMVSMAALWIAMSSPVAPQRLERYAILLLNGCLLISLIAAANHWYLDSRFAYSGSREAAAFLKSTGLESREIAAHNLTQAEAVLPYLPGKKFWYPGRDEYGTYMKWDRTLDRAVDMTYPAAEDRARKFFTGRPFLLLLNVEIPQPAERGFRLLYRTSAPVFGRPDERYWLYEPLAGR